MAPVHVGAKNVGTWGPINTWQWVLQPRHRKKIVHIEYEQHRIPNMVNLPRIGAPGFDPQPPPLRPWNAVEDRAFSTATSPKADPTSGAKQRMSFSDPWNGG